jgi:hypothetical protein
MEDETKPPLWLTLMNCQIDPRDWCIPVEQVWRRHGWIPPSKECADTMAKQQAFRTWTMPLC